MAVLAQGAAPPAGLVGQVVRLAVTGIRSAHCVDAITRALRAYDPVARIWVEPADGRVTIAGRLRVAHALVALAEVGHPAVPLVEHPRWTLLPPSPAQRADGHGQPMEECG